MAIEIKLSRIQLIIIQSLLWFYGIIGISFGGFSIDSKRRVYSNIWLKIYGLSLAIVMVIYDLYQYFWYFERHITEAKGYETYKNAPDQIKIPIIILTYANQVAWFCFKKYSLILFSFKGFNVIKDIIEKLSVYQSFEKRNTKISLILLIWLTIIVINLVIATRFDGSWRIVVWLIEYKLCLLYKMAIVIIVWITSVTYSSKLNELLQDLKYIAESHRSQGIYRT